MKKIGIVQVDGEIPNLALMQVCGYHESLGDKVEWYKGNVFEGEYDKIYASKLFSFSEMPQLPERALVGGTGIDFRNNLPDEIKTQKPSYSLYLKPWKPFNYTPKKTKKGTKKKILIDPVDYHLGFSMKGCRFVCKFCCVPQKEGRPKYNNSVDEILTNPLGGNRLMLLDNDFFGSPNWKEDLERIIELKLKVCFVQGLNIRIITKEQAELLAKCNYKNSNFKKKYVTFAWDRQFDKKRVMDGIQICNDAGIPSTNMQFFVLIGYDTTPEQDYERVMTLAEMGCMPYVMPFKKTDPYQKAFTRWVNQRAVFNSCSWSEYKYNKFPTV
jgi:hypothetical protein